MNPIKTSQEMLAEMAGIPHLAGGSAVPNLLTSGAAQIFNDLVKKATRLKGAPLTAQELAIVEKHANSLTKPAPVNINKVLQKPEVNYSKSTYELGTDPNLVNPDDLRDPFVVKQMMPSRTKAGTNQAPITEEISALGTKEAPEVTAKGEYAGEVAPKISSSDIPSYAEEGMHPGSLTDTDLPVSQSTWAPSSTPSSDYLAQMSQRIEQNALNEKAIGKDITVYEMLREQFAKENGRYPTADEFEQLVAAYNPARANYRGGELRNPTTGEGYDALAGRPSTARGMEAWRQEGRDYGILENYLQRKTNKYSQPMQDALEILRGEIPLSKIKKEKQIKSSTPDLQPIETRIDENGNLVKVYPAVKKDGGHITAEQMRHMMVAHGKEPEKFKGGRAVANIAGNLAIGAPFSAMDISEIPGQLAKKNYDVATKYGLSAASGVTPYFLIPQIALQGHTLSDIAASNLARDPVQRKQMQDVTSTPLGGALAGDAALAAHILGNRDYEERLASRAGLESPIDSIMFNRGDQPGDFPASREEYLNAEQQLEDFDLYNKPRASIESRDALGRPPIQQYRTSEPQPILRTEPKPKYKQMGPGPSKIKSINPFE